MQITYTIRVLLSLFPPLIAYLIYVLRLLRLMNKIFTFPLITLALSTQVVAQAPTENTSQDSLNTVVVTGGRTELLTTSPSSSYVFTQEDIDKTSATDVATLLSRVPGVSMDHSGGRGASSNIRIRGSESDHVLILIDGVRTASATNGTTALQNIPLSQIERIEVIKGPKSGIYGADALGGVVQIFTKKGKDYDNAYVEVGAGSHSSGSLAAGFNAGQKNIYYGVNVNKYKTDGISRQLNTTGDNADIDGYDEKSISFNIGRDALTGLNTDFSYLRTEGDVDVDLFGGTLTDHTESVSDTVSFSSDYKLSSQLEINLDLGYFKDNRETFASSPSIFETERDSVTTFFKYDLDSNQSLILGYDYYDDKVTSTTSYSSDERANEGYFTEYALNNEAVNIQLAYRQDRNERYGENDSGSIYVAKPLSGNQLVSFSYGRAFKAPTFNDSDFPFQFGFIGNPDIQPEQSRSIELGYSKQWQAMTFDVSIYKTEIINLIQLTPTFSTVENVGEAELLGGEISLTGHTKTIDFGTSFSYVDAKNKLTNARLTRRPRAIFTSFLTKKMNDKLSLSGTLTAEDTRSQSSTTETGGFGVVDLGLDYNITRSSQLSVNANNVFDKEYLLIAGSTTFSTEGRTFDLSYKYTF